MKKEITKEILNSEQKSSNTVVYQYPLTDGKCPRKIPVEVTPEVRDCLDETQREIWRTDKKFQRKTYSHDAALYEGSDYGNEDTYFAETEDELLANDKRLADKAAAAWDSLTETQRRRTKLYQENGHSLTKVAKIEGCAIQTVKESVDAALKKMTKILKQTP